MMELFFSKFSTIDIHDHYRQGSLAIEREWITRNWTHRLFSTILGMVVVDAYLAYRYDTENAGNVDFNDFASQLAHQLIFNEFETARSTHNGDGDSESSVEGAPDHHIKPFIELPQYAAMRLQGKRPQRKCGVCKKKASYYCAKCSDVAQDIFFGICGPRSDRACYSAHLSSSSI
ncbi:hypothetical protein PHMEG_00023695 [Phytophthora megakarya]|uniref:PiggyBac transposable element-derived protein domain-containing protein n=1 Tax=Phytophthora megakarya TaxID=4795 RepID=A0A225VFR8_9STRA|nr:hypothetical protein PHMEG_00023695 [Phytophthora megakarya]